METMVASELSDCQCSFWVPRKWESQSPESQLGWWT
jgi:hypothetical protein